ncbi:MAG: restriction endonuclease subunit S [Flavobacterium sp.]|nr:restriction endonuclease subunit S [Flavobacterium sp.]
MKEATNIPELRFSEFVDDWQKTTIKNVFNIFNGYAFKSSDGADDGCRWIKIADVGINRINNETKSFLPQHFLPKHKKFLLKDGDYVVALTRPILGGKLKIARIDGETNDSLLNQRVGKLITKNNIEFVYQTLQQRVLIAKIENRIAGSDPPNLSPYEINSIKVSVPSLPEQTKIADFLTTVDKRIYLLTQQKEKLEQYKKGVMQQIFNQQIRFKDNDGNNFPDWEETTFGLLYKFISTNSLSRDKLNYQNGDVQNIHYGDIHTKFRSHFNINTEDVPYINIDVNLKNIKDEAYLKEGDLVIADASEDYADIGKTIEICRINNKKVLAGLHTLVARKRKEKLIVGFGGHLMKTWQMRLEIMRIAQGTKVLSISTKRLGDISLKLPSKEEQQKIASFLSAINKKIELVSQQIDYTTTWKKGLLQKMFV